MLNHKILSLTGLPYSGINTVSQLLTQHPHIYSSKKRSPLVDILVNLRSIVSNNPQTINYSNNNFDEEYQRLLLGFTGFINGWLSNITQPWVVDANPQWLQHIELINLLDPDFKMVVFVRELGQIYGAMEDIKKPYLSTFQTN